MSLLLRYGMCLRFSSNAATTSPSALRLLLMCCASFNRSPAASDRDTRSEPAKSTRCNRPEIFAPDAMSTPSQYTVTTEWLRLDLSLSAVSAEARRDAPSRITSSACAGSRTTTLVAANSSSSSAFVAVLGLREFSILAPLAPPFQLASFVSGTSKSRTRSLYISRISTPIVNCWGVLFVSWDVVASP